MTGWLSAAAQPAGNTLQSATADALALAQLVRDAVTAGVPRRALHLRLSRLDARLRHGQHGRLLREALEPALRPARSRLFELPNGDLVAIAPAQGRHLEEAGATLTFLLAPDMAAGFALLDLPRDAAAVLAAVAAGLEGREASAAPVVWSPMAEPARALDPAGLAGLEDMLRRASLARFLRCRPVCRLPRGAQGPEVLWEEWRLAWPELRAALCPEADAAAAPWLRRRLRRLLDRRLLAELARPEVAHRSRRLGLSLAPSVLGEKEFLRLDGLLDGPARAGTVIALPAGEALADPEGFAFARDFVRARGYRLAVDMPGPDWLRLLSPGLTGTELLRLPWSAELAASAPSLAAPDRVVLTDVDRTAAIGWGWEAGVSLFEGRLLRPRT